MTSMVPVSGLERDEHDLAAFCRIHRIRTLAVFGSALRGGLRHDSDIDVLVEFEPDHTPGMLGMARME